MHHSVLTSYRSKAKARAELDTAQINKLAHRLKLKKIVDAATYLKMVEPLLKLQALAGASTPKMWQCMAINQRWILDVTTLMLKDSTTGTASEQKVLRNLRRPHALYLKHLKHLQ